MAKEVWAGGNMLYPLPVVMVSCANEAGERDIVTVAWTGTVCTNPPMLYISLRPERHSYHIIRESGEFVVNLVSRGLQQACDWCGVRSGRAYDKWAECGLTAAPASTLSHAPLIDEAPVSLECRVVEVKELGSHHMFLAEVTAVQVERELLDEMGSLDLARADLTAYSHGTYHELGRELGTFGYSVRKKGAAGKASKASMPGSSPKGGSKKPGKGATSKGVAGKAAASKGPKGTSTTKARKAAKATGTTAKAKGENKPEKHAARKAGKLTPAKDRRTTTYHIPAHDPNHRRSTRKH